MKLLSYRHAGQTRHGALKDGAIVPLDGHADLKALLAAGPAALQSASASVATAKDRIALKDVELLPPIPNPGTIWCAGMNTHSHFEEAKAFMHLTAKPPKPILFLRSTATLVASGQDLEKPKLEKAFDYEGEIAIVIGTRGRNIAPADAMKHVAGFAPFNDGSAREYQRSSAQITAGKNAWRSGGFGPYLVTCDEVDEKQLTLATRLNGEQVQHMKVDDLIFGFADLVSFISEFTWLEPGDVIVTGSPAGVGFIIGKLLKPGDRVEVEVGGVGILVNGVREQA
jgi:2-keto-4-pentenoate hydratase/2-oxohepta-3-ene-1,7-dioic acid hydratase in catechol pathway